MWIVKGTISVAASLAAIAVVTAVLYYARLAGVGPHHPVFFYLLPIAAIAIVFGTLTAMLSAAAATACSAFFLYDPVHSFYVANTLEWGDLICFAVLAAMGIKCTVEFLRPSRRISPAARGPLRSKPPKRTVAGFRSYRSLASVEQRKSAQIQSWDAS